MHNLTEADKIYDEMRENGTDILHEMMLIFREKMPHEYCMLMKIMKYGCHIYNEEMYNDAISYLKWANNKGEGAKWDVESIIKLSDINFEEVKFYEYDYAYIVNMLWSDYCNIFTDTSYYIKMGKQFLMDEDYPGNADERAYYNAIKRIEYFKNK